MSGAGARRALPRADQVTALPVARATTAPPDWEDHNGHVNVTGHYLFHMQACHDAFADLGIDQDYVHRHGQSAFSVEHHVSFFDEVLVGHELSAHLLVLDRSDKLLHAVSVMVDRTTDRIASSVEFVEAHVDLATRRTCPFQPDIAKRLDEVLEAHRALGWTFPLNGSMGLRRD
ncbi:thioesterase [Nocardioides albidus]|uniref:Thioesterase n=1 Tax=Nocardioides albidus TaxID=1517589 RepID=A0A5C4VM44_9ACTN|nr:thioesterase family protein [Nocardioides albidus]TNM36516.1 thioesterase [Nocardioides albidus]